MLVGWPGRDSFAQAKPSPQTAVPRGHVFRLSDKRQPDPFRSSTDPFP